LAVIVSAMALHALVWYPLVSWLVGRKSPRAYLGGAADAVVTGIATNSSLATVPVTLRCLDKMNVSPESSRLAACVGTNLNNDGITLYEATAALVIAQACGFDAGMSTQLSIALAALVAGLGIAGIPEAGLVVLPTVLSAAGFPDAVIAVAVPLVVPVDWLLARCRTVLNVLSDMAVAIAIDRSPLLAYRRVVAEGREGDSSSDVLSSYSGATE
jgi:Na+/H+-dicarboxylate symporter